MTSQHFAAGGLPQRPAAPAIVLLTPKEAAGLLKVSTSWLAKARMRGDGPPYIRFGRAIRYGAAGDFETFLPRTKRSPSDVARYKRLERSKVSLRTA